MHVENEAASDPQMSEMNRRVLDLDLLVAFNAVMPERSGSV
jgi:hypothetical protein